MEENMYKGIKHMKGMLAVALMALLVACGSAGSGSDDKPGDDQPGAPLNISITADPASVEASGVTNLTASISGEGAATGTVNWSADEGPLSADAGLSVTWTAPAAAGVY